MPTINMPYKPRKPTQEEIERSKYKDDFLQLIKNNKFPIEISNYYTLQQGKILYDEVIENQPDVIIEFGTGDGFTSLCMACALKKNEKGKIYSYDLFDSNSSRLVDLTKQYMHIGGEVQRLGLTKYIEFGFKDFYKWIDTADVTESFDMLYVDVGNTGTVVTLLKEKLKKNFERGATVLFEGGGTQRDKFTSIECGRGGYWGRCKNHSNIGELKDELGFTVLSHSIPSISKFINE
tara:strand:- start:412 stop:1116 length:705 start_codon:yes stop_codon:yes gene_type:complete